MSRTTDSKFTVEHGLEIQQMQMAKWKRLLKPEVYAELEARVKDENECGHPATGFDVFMGNDIDILLLNEVANMF
jgi:hypothetical protein